jgi:hypothetical protein
MQIRGRVIDGQLQEALDVHPVAPALRPVVGRGSPRVHHEPSDAIKPLLVKIR